MLSSAAFGPRPKVLARDDSRARAHARSNFGRRRSDYVVLLVGCVAFVAARNLTAGGRVTIDQFQYWLIGLLPFLAIILAAAIYRYFVPSDEEGADFDEGFFALAWLLSLLQFVALRVTLWSETFEFPLYEMLGFNLLAAKMILAVVYSVLGYATTLAVRQVVSPQRKACAYHISGIGMGCSFNAVLFYVLVFSHTS